METLLKDLRFALRALIRNPVLTTVAIVSLALGIGANTTIFTLVNAIFLRGLPIAEPERVMTVFTTEDKQAGSPIGRVMPVSHPNYRDLQSQTSSFEELVEVMFQATDLASDDGEPEQVASQIVGGGYFEMLGVEPFHGRLFGPEDDVTPGAHPVAVLSYRFWQRRFGGDSAILGETLQLNRQPFTVIGIAPPGFEGTFTLGLTDFWAPIAMWESFLTGQMTRFFEDRRALLVLAYGRLAPGVTIEEARSEIQGIGGHLQEAFPKVNENRNFDLIPVAEAAINPVQRDNFVRASGLLMTVVGLILLIACVNVANLLLARATARRGEIAVRMSLGAPRSRLVRQLLTESLLLALLAGGVGVTLAHWARAVIWEMRPPFMQQGGLDLSFDSRVLGFTLLTTVFTGVLFGLVPALRATRPGLVNDLKDVGGESGGRFFKLRNLLVTAQVALSFVALIGSGIFLRSLAEATRIDLGFEPGGLAMMRFDLGRQGYDRSRGEPFLNRAVETARNVPGVEQASLVTIVPLTFGGFMRTVFVEGRAENDPANGLIVPANIVDPDYFKTLRIELVSGRDFTAADRTESVPVAIVNTAMAERFWHGEDPVGRRFTYYGEPEVWEVVGVVATSKYLNIGEDPQPQSYVPRLQSYSPAISLVIRTAAPSESVLETVRQEIQALEPMMPITQVQTMETLVGQALWAPRMTAILLAVMGGLALLLASIGIYGVMAYSVSQRRHEMGIRMAMGARGDHLLRMILSRGMLLVASGLGLGLVLALAAGRKVAPLLYDGVSPTDATTYAVTAAVLAVVSLVANWIPARRATVVDPVEVLRRER